MGRPKGSKNKKTLEKEKAACAGCAAQGVLEHSLTCQESHAKSAGYVLTPEERLAATSNNSEAK